MTAPVTTPARKPDPFDDPRKGRSAARLGLVLFLASLVMLFGATIAGFIVIRVLAENPELNLGPWPENLPSMPALLWVSSAILIVSSLTMQAAVKAIRNNSIAGLRRQLGLTIGLGFVFLILQGICWWIWYVRIEDLFSNSDAHRFALTSFYVLTLVHGLHVIGGLIPMLVTWCRSARYSADAHGGVERCAMYWHFLDGVWLVLFAMLLVGV